MAVSGALAASFMIFLLMPPTSQLPRSFAQDDGLQSLTVVVAGEQQFNVNASLSNGKITNATADADFSSLILDVDTTADAGELIISLPRSLIDAKAPDSSSDEEFIVVIDNDEAIHEETRTTDVERELQIAVPANAKRIEIVGTQVVPEFPAATFLLAGASIAAIIAAASLLAPRNRFAWF